MVECHIDFLSIIDVRVKPLNARKPHSQWGFVGIIAGSCWDCFRIVWGTLWHRFGGVFAWLSDIVVEKLKFPKRIESRFLALSI